MANRATLIKKAKEKSKVAADLEAEDIKKDVQFLKDNLNNIFSFYEACGFDMVPVQANDKRPIEQKWTIKEHKYKKEWLGWIDTGINIGVKTGKCSNLTILDLDTKTIPVELKPFLENYRGFSQESTKGFHYAYKYEKELPKNRISKWFLDIENDGGQVVLNPSLVEGKSRKILMTEPIPVMPEGLKKLLLKNVPSLVPKLNVEDEVKQVIETEDLRLVGQGNRNNFLIKYGGILRKQLNPKQTKFVMELANKVFIKPPLQFHELRTCIKSLERYSHFDQKEMSDKILEYIRMVPDKEATERDIREALSYPKQDIEKALSYLMREEFIIKKRRTFHLIQRPDWKEEFMDAGKKLDFKFPYFDHVAVFRNADMVVIGGKTGEGKSHIAMNIIKKLVAQNIKPNYVSLESGNRFSVIAAQLGLREGNFKWDIHYNPEHVELEKDAFTIIDWLLPKDYANTDKLFEYFSQQLRKNNGVLLIFVQLRSNGDFFAKDMIEFFPSFVCKFFYESETERERSYFLPTKAREAKIPNWKNKILTRYGWTSKELELVADDEEDEEQE